MDAVDFVRDALRECFTELYGENSHVGREATDRVARVRFTGSDQQRWARGPSILWWVSVLEREPLIDGAAPANGIGFRFECRAEEIDGNAGASRLLQCVMDRLAPHILAVEDHYDEEDNPSQQRLDYFACVARVILPKEIEVEAAATP